MKQNELTISKAEYILERSNFNTKKLLDEELGITRPTLDSRLSGKSQWKRLEIKWIDHIHYQLRRN